MKRLDLTGERYGRLVVVRMCESSDGHGNSMCICRCDCGTEKTMKSRSLTFDNTRSCGCLLKWRVPGYKKRIHYHVWIGIKYRCYKKTNSGYPNYGAKGVGMCPEWKNDYWAFHKWMDDNNWRPGLQVDRFPNKKGNYEPSNCRLATPKMQQNNRNNNVLIEFNGQKKTVSEWGHDYGIKPTIVFSRIRDGWNISDALTKEVGVEFGYKKRIRNKFGQFA